MRNRGITYYQELFLAYLDGSLSNSAESELLEGLRDNPELLKDFRQLMMVWNLEQLNSDLDKTGPEQKYHQLKERLEITDVSDNTRSIRLNPWVLGVAASFIFGAVLSFALAYYIYHPVQEEVVYHEVHSPHGAKSQVTLPDGSTIWLNAGSSIKYSNEYGKDSRQVELLGEAYFDVKTNKEKVFTVHTSALDINAYGTVFNVKSYPEENTIETTLVEGSIGVTRNDAIHTNKEIVLKPNQRVVYYKGKKEVQAPASVKAEKPPVQRVERNIERNKLRYMVSKGIDTEPFTAWKDGRLMIKSQNLADLAILLERKYDVSIRFGDPEIKEFRFSGSLENETIEQVITAIGLAANIKYEIDERDVVISRK